MNNLNEPIIFKENSSKHVFPAKGWTCRNKEGKSILGVWTDKHQAELMVSTHKRCTGCNSLVCINHSSLCEECLIKNRIKKYEDAPKKRLDELDDYMLWSDESQKYYYNIDEAFEDLEDRNASALDNERQSLKNFRLYICAPQTPSDYWQDIELNYDDIPEGGELPAGDPISIALECLNKAINESKVTLGYRITKFGLDVVDL